MIPFITPIQVRRLREQTIYSRPHGKDVMELEPHQVPLTPDTKLLPTHCPLKIFHTTETVNGVFEWGHWFPDFLSSIVVGISGSF